MSSALQARPSAADIEAVLVKGDLSPLSEAQRLAHYRNVCESLGLNPLTQPFDYIKLNGKLVLYAKRDAAEQLRKIHGVSIIEMTTQRFEEVYVVTVKAQDKTGRTDISTGAVSIGGLKGEALANAFLKTETKAKRRVTLSICGLGMLDETEVESIPHAQKQLAERVDLSTGEIIEQAAPVSKPAPKAETVKTEPAKTAPKPAASDSEQHYTGLCVGTEERKSEKGATFYEMTVDKVTFATSDMNIADHAATLTGERVTVVYRATPKGGKLILSVDSAAVGDVNTAFLESEFPPEKAKR